MRYRLHVGHYNTGSKHSQFFRLSVDFTGDEHSDETRIDDVRVTISTFNKFERVFGCRVQSAAGKLPKVLHDRVFTLNGVRCFRANACGGQAVLRKGVIEELIALKALSSSRSSYSMGNVRLTFKTGVCVSTLYAAAPGLRLPSMSGGVTCHLHHALSLNNWDIEHWPYRRV